MGRQNYGLKLRIETIPSQNITLLAQFMELLRFLYETNQESESFFSKNSFIPSKRELKQEDGYVKLIVFQFDLD